MISINLTPLARDDLRGIISYTQDRWGFEQADDYIDQIYNAFEQIAAHPSIGRTRDEIQSGLRSMRHREHSIFYRAENDHVEIIRVLHKKRDVSLSFDIEE